MHRNNAYMNQHTNIPMGQVDEWLDHLRNHGRKDNTLATYRNNIRQCFYLLRFHGLPTDVRLLQVEHIVLLWRELPVKEGVKRSYLRNLSGLVEYHTGVDIVKKANLLYNRECHDRLFIDKAEFKLAFSAANEYQKVILCLGAYMGLRRAEMANIRDGDIRNNILTIHGKGHGVDGMVTNLRIPPRVLEAIEVYRASKYKQGERADDYLLQCRSWNGTLHRVHLNKISDTVARLGRSVGISLTTHSLRRFYATTLYYDANCDLQTMRKLMRHADVATTLKCYVNANDREERKASDTLMILIDELIDCGE